MPYQTENEAYVGLLCTHLRRMTERMRQVPEDLWDWCPAPPGPTTRIIAAHAWQCLISDRQHLSEPDALKHPLIPDPPHDPTEMCDALDKETDQWEALIMSLTPEELDAPRMQFNKWERGVRNFICHMIQNSIYKHGQFATLYFSLGLDGKEEYQPPWPNDFYKALHDDSL